MPKVVCEQSTLTYIRTVPSQVEGYAGADIDVGAGEEEFTYCNIVWFMYICKNGVLKLEASKLKMYIFGSSFI